jgi:hypothetical protein
MIKGQGVEGQPELCVLHHRGQVGFHNLAVGFKKVIVLLAGGRPKEPAQFAGKGCMLLKGVSLGTIVFGVDDNGLS